MNREEEKAPGRSLADDLREGFVPSQSSSSFDRKDGPSLYAFISFDLANSTSLKSIDSWILVLSRFFEAITRYAQENGFSLWKYRGDEALFFKFLSRGCSFYDLVVQCEKLNERINTEFLNRYGEYKTPKSKCTVWLACVQTLPTGAVENVEGQIKKIAKDRGTIVMRPAAFPYVQDNSFEFLGLSIDAGFRVAQYAHPDVVTTGLDLASLALEEVSHANEFRVVSFRELKGVSAIPQPIIWFSKNWHVFDSANFSPVNSSSTEQEITASSLRHKLSRRQSKRLIEQFGLKERLRYIKTLKKNASPIEVLTSADQSDYIGSSEKNAEVHCVAVCFNSKREVLVGQRQFKANSSLSEKWEFGCAQVRMGQTFHSAIRLEYQRDFGIEVESLYDYPISSFIVPGKGYPGIIFCGYVEKDTAPKSGKYKEVLWSSPKFLSFSSDECVEGFEDTLARAVEAFENWSNNNGS